MVRKRSFIQSEPIEKPSDVNALSSFLDVGEDQDNEFTTSFNDDEFTSEEESSYESSNESYSQQQRYPAERSPTDYQRHGFSSMV